ncbi:uncharacterized protein LOC144247577 [Lonchura striata]
MDQVFPEVWASDVPGKAKNTSPIQIRLKEGKQPVRVKQYPLKREDREGISPVIENFLRLGILKECQSDFNTPILPVSKPDGSYRLVQDLRAVNKVTEDLYPVVANPYMLLTCLTPELTWFTILDLKDAFFCLPIHEASQKIFAFEWESPKSGRKTQLTWTRLPQGYKNSPTLFGEQLAKELETWKAPPEEGKLLQYVDDILIATRMKEACVAWTVSLLNFLGRQGYQVSKKKAQVVKQKVIYLGYEVSVGQPSFLSGNQGEPVEHDCLETIEATYSSRPDLKDTPLENAEVWFTDRSSYVISGKRHAGYAVTTYKEVIESRPLPTNTSAQKAEIVALTWALELVKGKQINIYTDSKYAFGVVHAHGAIWKERGLLSSQGKNIKHASEILQLLEAVQLPEKVAIMHIKAHQRINSELEEGNELADRKAKEAAKIEVINEAALIPDGQISLEALLRIRTKPRTKEKLSPFELLYGRPYGVQKGTSAQDVSLTSYMIALNKQLRAIEKYVAGTRSAGLDAPVHDIQPGDYVYVKSLTEKALEPQ